MNIRRASPHRNSVPDSRGNVDGTFLLYQYNTKFSISSIINWTTWAGSYHSRINWVPLLPHRVPLSVPHPLQPGKPLPVTTTTPRETFLLNLVDLVGILSNMIMTGGGSSSRTPDYDKP
jgi:hypothetical protein